MALRLYMDHHVPRALTIQLRLRDVDVITAFEDEASTLEDPQLLDRVSELERVLFTRDDDLLVEASLRQQVGHNFSGVIYAHQLHVSIGICVQDLELLAKAGTPADVAGTVIFLPL